MHWRTVVLIAACAALAPAADEMTRKDGAWLVSPAGASDIPVPRETKFPSAVFSRAVTEAGPFARTRPVWRSEGGCEVALDSFRARTAGRETIEAAWRTGQNVRLKSDDIPVLEDGVEGRLSLRWFAAQPAKTQLCRGKEAADLTQSGTLEFAPGQWRSIASLAPPHRKPANSQPAHPNETADVTAVREYRYRVGEKEYRILRGDLHRHTDISIDGIGDGSLPDFYRYAFSAGQDDFMMVADHQYGNTEHNRWRTDKSEDAFRVPGRFWPPFGTERSVSYPNGHRNTVFARRGIRELPLTPGERDRTGDSGPVLYPYPRKFGGIATSHSSATDQGTDWRDNDPGLEPVVEIYQGLHASYEYEGAPRAETPEKRFIHHGEQWRPAGFVWNAWAKGLKLGVQASSDHIATHDAYACLIVEGDAPRGRESLLDAMRRRHTCAATDNIILDVRIGDHLMGDVFSTPEQPVLKVRVRATGPIEKVEVIKNNTFIHTVQPGGDSAEFEFRDHAVRAGDSYYYVRVMQSDGQLAWSSPIWVNDMGL